jgi:hypothetical protein
VTCFDVRYEAPGLNLVQICASWTLSNTEASSDGCFLGYGSSDLTIGVLDAKALSVLNPLHVTPESRLIVSLSRSLQSWRPTIFRRLHSNSTPVWRYLCLAVLTTQYGLFHSYNIQSEASVSAYCLLTDRINIKFRKAWGFILLLLAVLVAVLGLFLKQYTNTDGLKWWHVPSLFIRSVVHLWRIYWILIRTSGTERRDVNYIDSWLGPALVMNISLWWGEYIRSV